MNAQLNKFPKKLCFYLQELTPTVLFLGVTVCLFLCMFTQENPKLLNSLKFIPLKFEARSVALFIIIFIFSLILYYIWIKSILNRKLLKAHNSANMYSSRNTFKRSLFIIQIASIIVSSFLFFSNKA